MQRCVLRNFYYTHARAQTKMLQRCFPVFGTEDRCSRRSRKHSNFPTEGARSKFRGGFVPSGSQHEKGLVGTGCMEKRGTIIKAELNKRRKTSMLSRSKTAKLRIRKSGYVFWAMNLALSSTLRQDFRKSNRLDYQTHQTSTLKIYLDSASRSRSSFL